MQIKDIGAEERPFIRVEGRRFFEGDRPFYFVGANLNVMHEPHARKGAAITIAAAAADGLRVGRIWALGEGLAQEPGWKRQNFLFRAGPDGWQEPAFKQLDQVIAEAGRHGLRLIVTLSNRWADYGGVPMYLRWAGYVDVEAYGFHDRFFADPSCKFWFLQHVRQILERRNSLTGTLYRDDPTIMAWELMNEMAGTTEAAETRRRWVQEMAREVRRLAPRHLIVPGQIGYNLQAERSEWQAMCTLPEVAWCDQHAYPEEHLRSKPPRDMLLFVDDRVQLAHHGVGKPIVFGEFGFGGPVTALARRTRLHRMFLDRIFFDGGNGALVWIYQPTLPWKRTFEVLVDDARYRPLRRTLGQVARQVASVVPENRNRAIGPAQGLSPIAPTHALLRGRKAPHRGWTRPTPGSPRELRIPVDQFYQARFEEGGTWDQGVLVHAYGRDTGYFEYRFVGPGFVPARLEIHVRLSSEYPNRSAPPEGTSRVKVLLSGEGVGELTVIPDDGLGRWVRVDVTDPGTLRGLAHGVRTLRFVVLPGPQAHGVTIYGREARRNREPVEDPGPMRLVAIP